MNNTKQRRIYLYASRSIGETLSATFDFVAQNFLPLIKFLSAFLLPVSALMGLSYQSLFSSLAHIEDYDNETELILSVVTGYIPVFVLCLIGALLTVAVTYTLMQKYQQAEEQYQQAARQLSALRKTAAKQLTAQIQTAMMELNFLDVQFRMEFQELEHPTRDGIDDAWFVLSTNVGESMKPLWEVASGGELSRIMLAIKSCLAQEDAIDTLIFDEIDVGISGRTAQKVSEQLSVLGREHQVICISHLPQIAAMADAHYKIEKKVEENKTITSIWKLSEEASITEIARMLGGVEITDTVKTSAAEMKEMAKRTKLY